MTFAPIAPQLRPELRSATHQTERKNPVDISPILGTKTDHPHESGTEFHVDSSESVALFEACRAAAPTYVHESCKMATPGRQIVARCRQIITRSPDVGLDLFVWPVLPLAEELP